MPAASATGARDGVSKVMTKVTAWRYRPYKVDGVATPVCFPVRFVFKFDG